MNEQRLFLILLILSLAISLGLWFYKAIKQVKYKNDERWIMIQLKANNAANMINWLLVIGDCSSYFAGSCKFDINNYNF